MCVVLTVLHTTKNHSLRKLMTILLVYLSFDIRVFTTHKGKVTRYVYIVRYNTPGIQGNILYNGTSFVLIPCHNSTHIGNLYIHCTLPVLLIRNLYRNIVYYYALYTIVLVLVVFIAYEKAYVKIFMH